MSRSVATWWLLSLLLVAASVVACRTPPLPPGVTYAQVTQGKRWYETYCAACHGLKGEGQDWRTPVPVGVLPAPPHTNEGHTWHHPDDQLLRIIAEGGLAPGSGMPAYKNVLTQAQAEAVLAYIKTMWGPEQRAHQAGLTNVEKKQNR